MFYRNWSWWLSYSGHVCQRELTIFIPKLQTRQIQNSTETNVKRHQESTERRVQSNRKDAHLIFKRNANLITFNYHLSPIRPTRVKVWHHDNLIKVWGNRHRTRFSLIGDNVALPSRVTNIKPLEPALLQRGEKCKVQSHLWSLRYNGKQCSGHGEEIFPLYAVLNLLINFVLSESITYSKNTQNFQIQTTFKPKLMRGGF